MNQTIPPNPLPCGCRAVGAATYGLPGDIKVHAFLRVEHCKTHAGAEERITELLAAGQELLALIDSVPIDAKLGDETDRVFPRYEFERLRAAIARSEG